MRSPSACENVTSVELLSETLALAGTCNGMSDIRECVSSSSRVKSTIGANLPATSISLLSSGRGPQPGQPQRDRRPSYEAFCVGTEPRRSSGTCHFSMIHGRCSLRHRVRRAIVVVMVSASLVFARESQSVDHSSESRARQAGHQSSDTKD